MRKEPLMSRMCERGGDVRGPWSAGAGWMRAGGGKRFHSLGDLMDCAAGEQGAVMAGKYYAQFGKY